MLIDNEDSHLLTGLSLFIDSHGYVKARSKRNNSKRKTLSIHRIVMGLPIGKQIDHINMDKLDNRKKNLRVCTNQQNCMNRAIFKNNTSGYKGVVQDKRKKIETWIAIIRVNYQRKALGSYLNKKEAALVYNKAAKKYFGDFAYLNKV